MDRRSDRHFSKKKQHTEIKHSIFTNTLLTSLSIANNLAVNDIKKQSSIYTYVDLFAGRGKFEDETEGSPLLAFNVFENHLTSSTNKNNFSNIRLLVNEKDDAERTSLIKELQEKLNSSKLKDHMTVYHGGNWEDYAKQIRELLSESKWGFIYADPFSTELDVEQLIQTIETYKGYKDIFIFVNLNTLIRQANRGHTNDINRVCKSIGVDPETLLQANDFSDLIKDALRTKFASLKHFMIGVAIPVTVEGKLITADYFYLLLATDSVKVADGFLNAYETEVNKFIRNPQPSFWGDYLADEIYNHLNQGALNGVLLYDLITTLFNKFLSWKAAVNDIHYKVPTINNIIDNLNTLYKKDKVSFISDGDFIYKRNVQGVSKGCLAYSKIRSGKDTRDIEIRLKS